MTFMVGKNEPDLHRLLVILSLTLVFLAAACSARPQPEVFSEPVPEAFSSEPSPTQIPLPDLDPETTRVPEILELESAPFTGAEIFGIHINDYTSDDQLSFLVNSGALWSRFDRFYWDLIEPIPQTPPIHDWSAVDEIGLLKGADMGVKTIGMILFTPTYAQKYPGSICGPIAEEQLERFGNFLFALVDRYSKAPYHVKYWEIGNEPDVDYAFANRSGFGCWGNPEDPYYGGGYYAQMLKIAYPRIKAADPQAQVLIGGLLLDCDPRNPPETSVGSGEPKDCSPSLFLDGILLNGGGDYFDGISFHAYDYYSFLEGKYSNFNWHSSSDTNGPVSIPKARFLQERLAHYGVSGKYLLNTESGLICGRTDKDPGCQTEEFSRTKAAYVVQSNTVALQLGLQINIWYSMLGWRSSELVSSNLQPLPAYDAYRFNARLLAEAVFVREVQDYPNMFISEFQIPEGVLWVVWSRSGEIESIHLPSIPTQVFDIYGNDLTPSQVISANYSPIYLVMPIQ
jgi:hypothetical protein